MISLEFQERFLHKNEIPEYASCNPWKSKIKPDLNWLIFPSKPPHHARLDCFWIYWRSWKSYFDQLHWPYTQAESKTETASVSNWNLKFHDEDTQW